MSILSFIYLNVNIIIEVFSLINIFVSLKSIIHKIIVNIWIVITIKIYHNNK